MKTNLPTSKFGKILLFLDKHRVFFILAFFLLAFLLAFLNACKSPSTLTNANDHHSRDSNYHAKFERIETHDTIVLGLPYNSTRTQNYSRDTNGKAVLETFAGGNLVPDILPLVRISDRTRTIHDTTFLLRTDTLIRTQTITQTERYIPPLYKFCTLTLATLATLATLYFSIRLLLRYLKIRSHT